MGVRHLGSATMAITAVFLLSGTAGCSGCSDHAHPCPLPDGADEWFGDASGISEVDDADVDASPYAADIELFDFLMACTDDADCASGYCVPDAADNLVCTQTCGSSCPVAGWLCVAVGWSQQSPVAICLPSNLVGGETGDVWTDLDSRNRPDASGDPDVSQRVDVPPDDDAWTPEVSDGETNPDGETDSTSSVACNDAALGQALPCTVSNEFGNCGGHRECTESGWSDCDAPEPAEEVCDGVDNNCSGLVDDGVSVPVPPCETTNEHGSCPAAWACLGTGGWACVGAVPAPEVCDFIDNNCNGAIDESFVGPQGLYVDVAHCGGCGIDCAGLIQSGQVDCELVEGVPTCVAAACEPGFYPAGPASCLSMVDRSCAPCAIDADCGGPGSRCLEIDGASRCGRLCGSDSAFPDDCAPGFSCESVGNWEQCVPSTGSCSCDESNAGALQPCADSNDFGSCLGTRECGPEGWSECSAPTAGPEVCNGLDDDCDGLTDIDAAEPAAPCEQGGCSGSWICVGGAGWSCTAAAPSAEVCNYLDDDCDGLTDEDFVDPVSGAYVDAEHCGGCGADCSAVVPHGVGTCVVGDSPGCVAEQCAPGYMLFAGAVCLPAVDLACAPCQNDADCITPGNRCLELDGAKICGRDCSAESLFDSECPSGFECSEFGDGPAQCVPTTGSCSCRNEVHDDRVRACSAANSEGTCGGSQTCHWLAGWTACSAEIPAAESCNGVDDDCDGAVDETVASPTEPCQNTNEFGECSGTWTCKGEGGWGCDAAIPKAETCDYLDNDCDGETDDGFRVDGRYTHPEHCGACGQSCSGAILFATTTTCAQDSVGSPVCIATACDEGAVWPEGTHQICVPESGGTDCSPCIDDEQCQTLNAGQCEMLDGSARCTRGCDDGDCPDGYDCTSGRCHPTSASCTCLDDHTGAVRVCTDSSPFGVCMGAQTCDPASGWSGCDASLAKIEVCNGLDDDCDGLADEGIVADPVSCSFSNEHGSCPGTRVCLGESGWDCTAIVPSVETCDYADNDCDGIRDDGFVDGDGRYITDAHCGACGSSCEALFPHSTNGCAVVDEEARCVITSCDPGYYEAGPNTCLPASDLSCVPCASDAACVVPGTRCIAIDGGGFCARDCSVGSVFVDGCGAGFACTAQPDGAEVCVPETGSCTCRLASQDGAARPCQQNNGFGACGGVETCEISTGWSACNAPVATSESCNGVDDDCDGQVDEGVGPPSELCENVNVHGICRAPWTCSGASGWTCPAQEPAAETCNYADDDCDGDVDETFAELGVYGTAEHCGGCGVSCAGSIPNADAMCSTDDTPRCVVESCEIGYFQAGLLSCLAATDTLCAPCQVDSHCPTPGDRCIDVDGVGRCGRDCSVGNVHGTPEGWCPDGNVCDQTVEVAQCVPTSGSCTCTSEGQDGATRPCQSSGELGTCYGSETCVIPEGWGGCSATAPVVETCNAIDDDCNGLVDDGVSAPSDSCELSNEFGACSGAWSCAGTTGWECLAQAPQAEQCNYLDDNCDGQIDEDFRDDQAGPYTNDAHCGACGATCDGALPNATARCEVGSSGATCVVDACAPGYYPAGAQTCLSAVGALCAPCETDSQCPTPGDACLIVDGLGRCGWDCRADNYHGLPAGVCPNGSTCVEFGELRQCIPDSGSCECLAKDSGAERPCSANNPVGTCFGNQVCDPEIGWGACSAATPAVETCNGVDDDCDYVVDDVPALGSPCIETNDFGSCIGVLACADVPELSCIVQVPSAETCNYIDDDCDGNTDEDYVGLFSKCSVGSGGCERFGQVVCTADGAGTSCDAEAPEAIAEVCDGIDNDCDGLTDEDFPTKGTVCTAGVGACKTPGVRVCPADGSAPVCNAVPASPLPEICNGVDDDCNEVVDDGLVPPACTNQVGTCSGSVQVCVGSSGWLACSGAEYGGGFEPTELTCDGVDNDCDGAVDEALFAPACALQAGACAGSRASCGGQTGWLDCVGAEYGPDYSTSEAACDGIDNDCNGLIDESWDTLGTVCSVGIGACRHAGTVICAADEVSVRCSVQPLASSEEQCNGLDDDCDDEVDEDFPSKGTVCTVGTGGCQALGTWACQPDGDDVYCSADAGNGAAEVCNGLDDDCNGLVDDAMSAPLCALQDGVCGDSTQSCAGSSGWTGCSPENYGDDYAVVETSCDGLDNDCDGDTDEMNPPSCPLQVGVCVGATRDCAGPAGWSDCAVGQYGAEYQATEDQCDGQDNDCDGLVDEGFAQLGTVCSVGVGACGVTGTWVCAPAADQVVCSATPGGSASELCNGIDDDCNGSVDDALVPPTCPLQAGVCVGAFAECGGTAGWLTCSPLNYGVAFEAVEFSCDGQDNDCDGATDDDLPASLCPTQAGSCAGSTQTCGGEDGWLECTGANFSPSFEADENTCDGLDNDCDGATDEGYRVAGAYVHQDHCGTCGRSCTGAIPHGTAACDGATLPPSCAVSECDAGYVPVNGDQCLPAGLGLCEPCVSDESCPLAGSRCLAIDDGAYCATPCDSGGACPSGYSCDDVNGETLCVPDTQTCSCDGSNDELQRICTETSSGPGDSYECFGVQQCTAIGWSTCALPVESCNLLDDDCDGSADEDFVDGTGRYITDEHCGACGNDCTLLSVQGATGVCDASPSSPLCAYDCVAGCTDVNGDLSDGCECCNPAPTDVPDSEGIDANCDGLDGDSALGIFVAKHGADTALGSREAPLRTLSAGVLLAVSQGRRDVYVATGVYGENVALAAGVSLYGGYSSDFAVHDSALYETAIIGQTPDIAGGRIGAITGVGISGVGEPTVVDGFTIFGNSAQTLGSSSYGVYLRECDGRLRLTSNHIVSGNGAPGSTGLPGQDGADGGAGGLAAAATDVGSCQPGAFLSAGGAAAVGVCGGVSVSGGAGGDGYCPDYDVDGQDPNEAGRDGANGGGGGGLHGYDGLISPSGGSGVCPSGAGCSSCRIPPGQLPMSGADGINGASGSPGGAGGACSTPEGQLQDGLWVGASGDPGVSGAAGGGGGGGGAGNGVMTCCNSNGMDLGGLGGGGGAGGCGSTGGQSGTGGGGTFGIFVFFDAEPTTLPLFDLNVIQRGLGGAGGGGGNAGVGGVGGGGGKGGLEGTGSASTFCAGDGGNGGSGGGGGHGGGGGGGCGGASYAVFATGYGTTPAGSLMTTTTVLTGGSSGTGGQGGLSLGSSGASGNEGTFAETNF